MASKFPTTAIEIHNELVRYLGTQIVETEFPQLRDLFRHNPLTPVDIASIKTISNLFACLTKYETIDVGDYKLFVAQLKRTHPNLVRYVRDAEKAIKSIVNEETIRNMGEAQSPPKTDEEEIVYNRLSSQVDTDEPPHEYPSTIDSNVEVEYWFLDRYSSKERAIANENISLIKNYKHKFPLELAAPQADVMVVYSENDRDDAEKFRQSIDGRDLTRPDNGRQAKIKKWRVVPFHTSPLAKRQYDVPFGINALKSLDAWKPDSFYWYRMDGLLGGKIHEREAREIKTFERKYEEALIIQNEDKKLEVTRGKLEKLSLNRTQPQQDRPITDEED